MKFKNKILKPVIFKYTINLNENLNSELFKFKFKFNVRMYGVQKTL